MHTTEVMHARGRIANTEVLDHRKHPAFLRSRPLILLEINSNMTQAAMPKSTEPLFEEKSGERCSVVCFSEEKWEFYLCGQIHTETPPQDDKGPNFRFPIFVRPLRFVIEFEVSLLRFLIF